MEILRVLRKSRGLTQDDVAEGANLSRETISMLERGKGSPKEETIVKLCDFYDVTPDEILTTKAYAKVYRRLMKENGLSRWGGTAADAKLALDIGIAQGIAEEEIEREKMCFLDFRNPDMFGFETDTAMEIKNSKSSAIVVSGPTRCGKTNLILEMILDLCFEHDGFQAIIVRAHTTDLPPIRQSLREMVKFRFDDKLSPIKLRGGYHDFNTLLFPNDSRLKLGGMNRPNKILGEQFNLVFYNQAEQSTNEEWEHIETRVAGTATNWTEEGKDRKLFIADVNPAGKNHHLLKRKDAGLLEWFEFGFDDNPLFARRGIRTEKGHEVVDHLDKVLTGIWHDRYFKGLWVSPEGAVFNVPEASIIDKVPEGLDLQIYRSMDFGMDHPSICLWIGEDSSGNTFVYREWRRTHTDIIQMGREVNLHTGNEMVKDTIIDHDENRQKLLKKECGISSKMARKGPGSIMDGIFLVQSAFKNAELGLDGGLYIVKDLVCNTDPNPDIAGKPSSLIEELETLEFDGNKDRPIDKGDDAVDALRYHYLYRSMKGKTVMASSSIISKEISHKGII